jgi:hypothetical protein
VTCFAMVLGWFVADSEYTVLVRHVS